MRNNRQLFNDQFQFQGTLEQFVQKEAELKVQELNGDNNKGLIKKMAKDEVQPWMAKYISTSRHLYRGCWFFEFLTEIFQNCYIDRKSKLSKLAGDAYNKSLGPHHPWVLRKVAGAAMVAVNYREVFIKNICTQQTEVMQVEYTEEQAYEDLDFLSKQTKVLSTKLLAYVEAHGLEKLP